MSVLEDLAATREVLAKPEAWTQGKLAKNSKGDGVAVSSPDAVCWCLVGAVGIVTDWPERVWPRWHAVIDVLRLGLELRPGQGLSGWNDDPDRTHAEVLALLDFVIARQAG